MPRRGGKVAEGSIYHVYNRGVNRQSIFLESRNYLFFRSRAASYFTSGGLRALAYCLMPNHYHLVVDVEDKEALPKAMHRLQMSYSKAINTGYTRTGPLFQGRYSLRPVSTAEDLLNLSRYIHMNPVLSGMVRQPEDWPHSSYRTYVGLEDPEWISSDDILEAIAPNASRRDQSRRYQEFVMPEIAGGRSLLAIPGRKETS